MKCKVKKQIPFGRGKLKVGQEAWAVDDDGGEGDDDDDDDLVISELATGLPGNQESGNIYYKSHTIHCMLILSPNLTYEKRG